MQRVTQIVGGVFISHKVSLQSFCTSQFPHKSVNLFFILLVAKDKFTDLWGSGLLPNDIMNTLCEVRLYPDFDDLGVECVRLETRN